MTEVVMTSEITVEPITVAANDAMVAQAARVSTKGSKSTGDGSIEGLIRALIREQHGTPFEHNLFTFRVHAPLFVMTEHLRHRVGWSYSGESGRYKTFEPVFYTPPPERGMAQVGKAIDYDIRSGTPGQREMAATFLQSNAEAAFGLYSLLLEDGMAREVARQVLPVNLMTTYFTSCNARSLMNFLALRTSSNGTSHPLWEIEQVALQYEDVFAEAMPLTYAAFDSFGGKAS